MRFAQGIIWGAMIGLMVCIVYWNVAPFGATYTKDMHDARSSAVISDFTPGDRVSVDVTIVHDPVYVLVRPPRRFATAVVEVEGAALSALRLGIAYDADATVVALADAEPEATTQAVYALDLAPATRDASGAYRLVFSARADAGVRVDTMSIHFK